MEHNCNKSYNSSANQKHQAYRVVEECGLILCGRGQGPVAGSCEQDNKY
jgi:hypothetical protein